MPFTFAHPAAILPIRRAAPRRFVLSALVIGSMTPDFAYLMPGLVSRLQSHSLRGSVFFSLPVGFATYVIYHLVLKVPLAALLPASLQPRAAEQIARWPGLPSRSIPAILFSLWVGALTHIAWDSFTHAGSPVVMRLPALSATLFTVFGYPVRCFRLLQHVSTLAGLLAIAWVLRGVARRAPEQPALALPTERLSAPERAARIAALVLLPAVAALALVWEDWREAASSADYHSAMFVTVATSLTCLGLALLVYGLAWHALRRRSGPS
ncbi:MAG TPA: DUF4184 family protein [Candidatus Sulfotelmatobacter sp.]|nr:DUF4184 family protein [Candidatus Sulfotelmatobacter sp.]